MTKKVQPPTQPGNDEQEPLPDFNFLGTEKILKDLIEKRTPELTQKVILDWAVRKLKKQGVAVTPEITTRLRRWIRRDGKGEFRARGSDKKRVALRAEFSPKDTDWFAKKFRRHVEKLYESGAIASINAAHKTLRPTYDRGWPEQSRLLRKSREAFEKRLHGRYGAGFELFSMQLELSRELGDSINQTLRAKWKTGEKVHLIDALSRLHARACHIGYEISTLLRAGYPDGAMARWRSLHEVSVVFDFINDKGAETALRYLDHDAIESWRAARGYNAMAKRLGHKPYTDEELAFIKSAADAALAKHGPEFEEEYGWASKALNNKRPKFAEIERAVGLDHFRPYYKFASHNVHANPKGILYKLSAGGNQSLLITGPSNVGLTDPANNAALTISRVTIGFARITESLDALCVASMLNKMPTEIGNLFWKAEKAIQADEAKIQRARRRAGLA